jgi:hypothetical protein
MTAGLAPSPPGAESRRGGGQGLLLSRTMLSNHELPYVGRFACDWLRLATTDPDAAHTTMVRRPGSEVPELADAESVILRWPAVSSHRPWLLADRFFLPAVPSGRLALPAGGRSGGAQVPVCHEPRYSSWAGVSRSIETPMVSSFNRAISASMALGTL